MKNTFGYVFKYFYSNTLQVCGIVYPKWHVYFTSLKNVLTKTHDVPYHHLSTIAICILIENLSGDRDS